jgi:hypothetical protein
VLEELAQAVNTQISGLDGLAQLIATVYEGAEEKLERHIGVPRGFSTKDWVHDHLDELEKSGEEAAIRRFLGQLSRIDQIADRLGIDIDDISHDKKPSAILSRLGILEYTKPVGIYADLDTIEFIESECRRIYNYRSLLGHGVDACTAIEHMLKLLILFYGGFCFEEVFSQFLCSGPNRQADWRDTCNKNISNPDMRKSTLKFFEREMSVELGPIITLLCKLDEYTQTLETFQQTFGRHSVFSHSAPNSTAIQNPLVVSPRPRRSRVEGEKELRGVLDEIRDLRNDLPHDKRMNPQKSELQTIEGLRPHLTRLFDAVACFKQRGEELHLFPSVGLLIQKFERINLGPRLELVSEDGTRVFIPCQDLADYIVGAEYFFWQGLGFRKGEYILVLKQLPLGG